VHVDYTKWHLDPCSHLAATDICQKLGGSAPFGGGGAGSPSNTMWPGPRPTCMPSFILIRPTVWPQYINVTDRTGQTGQTTVWYHRANRFTNGRPKRLNVLAFCEPAVWNSLPPAPQHAIILTLLNRNCQQRTSSSAAVALLCAVIQVSLLTYLHKILPTYFFKMSLAYAEKKKGRWDHKTWDTTLSNFTSDVSCYMNIWAYLVSLQRKSEILVEIANFHIFWCI